MKRALLLVLVVLLSVCGCSPSTTYVQGIPNLVQVRAGLWRSGQPTRPTDWKYLKSLGISHVIKLNFESEGSDEPAIVEGMVLHNLAIHPVGDADLWNALTNTFEHPDPRLLEQADQIIAENTGVLVHCTHGWDRTGLVVGRSRVLIEHWSKEDAYREMISRGFHPALHGLYESWKDWQP